MSDAYTWDNDVPTTDLDDIDFNNDIDFDDNSDFDDDSDTDNSEYSSVDDDYVPDEDDDYDISDDDIYVVMEDGSYIVIPYTLFDKLSQDEDFAEQMNEGFSDVASLQDLTNKILKG